MPSLSLQHALEHLVGAGDGQARGQPQEPGSALATQVFLTGQEGSEPRGVETLGIGHLDGRHHLITGPRIRHRINPGRDHFRMPTQDTLDRQRGDVLAVDPDPVTTAAGEVQETRLVPIPEVTGPIPAVADPLGVGIVVL